ncbi:uncharacterized protein [Rutidosis leptorrhynchoides]|uniref:uncharacterized protein n=1 Tax=Rutidosis leptorrhynchoides TaxID=125765 RepID=UPI003A99640E
MTSVPEKLEKPSRIEYYFDKFFQVVGISRMVGILTLLFVTWKSSQWKPNLPIIHLTGLYLPYFSATNSTVDGFWIGHIQLHNTQDNATIYYKQAVLQLYYKSELLSNTTTIRLFMQPSENVINVRVRFSTVGSETNGQDVRSINMERTRYGTLQFRIHLKAFLVLEYVPFPYIMTMQNLNVWCENVVVNVTGVAGTRNLVGPTIQCQ